MSGVHVLSVREAVKIARKKGWKVEAKRRSGAMVFTAPNGQKFTAAAPGRRDRVPMVLAKALK